MSAKKMRRGHAKKRPSSEPKRAKAKKLLELDESILALERFDDTEQDVKDRIHQMVQERTEFDPETDCQIFTGAWEENGQAKMRVGARVYCLSRIVAWLYHPGFQLWGLNRAVR